MIEIREDEIVIETARLWLRSMRAKDFDSLLTIFTDTKVMAAFHSSPFNDEQMQGWLQRNLDHQMAHGYGLFSVILKENNSLIGDCGLEVMEIEGVHAAELGYDFRSDYWNQGFATEAACAIRDFAFQQLHLPHLVCLIRVGNQRSRRVAEKIGMSYSSDHQSGERTYWMYEMAQKAP